MHEFIDHLLTTWRTGQGISKAEAARQIGISPTFYAELESGRRVPKQQEHVETIARLLDTDTDRIDCACGRVPADIIEHLAGDYRAVKRVRSLEGI